MKIKIKHILSRYLAHFRCEGPRSALSTSPFGWYCSSEEWQLLAWYPAFFPSRISYTVNPSTKNVCLWPWRKQMTYSCLSAGTIWRAKENIYLARRSCCRSSRCHTSPTPVNTPPSVTSYRWVQFEPDASSQWEDVRAVFIFVPLTSLVVTCWLRSQPCRTKWPPKNTWWSEQYVIYLHGD